MPPDPQSGTPERRSFRLGLIPWAAALLLAYVLSVGPAVVLCYKPGSRTLESAFEFAYFPLILLAEHSPPAEKILEQYVEWWLKATGTLLWG